MNGVDIFVFRGKLAIFFHDGNRKASATCVGKAWYFGWEGKDGWWGVNEFEERGLAWAYIGSVEKLRDHVTAILAGKEVVVTAARRDMAGGGSRELWDNQTAYQNLARDTKIRVWRIRASFEITSHPDVRDKPDYVVGLGTGDREAVPALVKDLQSKDPSVRSQAAEDLGQVGPDARDAIPVLTGALDDPDGRVRVNAAEAVCNVVADRARGAHDYPGAYRCTEGQGQQRPPHCRRFFGVDWAGGQGRRTGTY